MLERKKTNSKTATQEENKWNNLGRKDTNKQTKLERKKINKKS